MWNGWSGAIADVEWVEWLRTVRCGHVTQQRLGTRQVTAAHLQRNGVDLSMYEHNKQCPTHRLVYH